MFKSLIASIRIIECIVRSNETCKRKMCSFLFKRKYGSYLAEGS